jgi:hypothetical protein
MTDTFSALLWPICINVLTHEERIDAMWIRRNVHVRKKRRMMQKQSKVRIILKEGLREKLSIQLYIIMSCVFYEV